MRAPDQAISLDQAMYSPHFYMLLIGCTGVSMTGLPLILTSKFIINDIFGPSLGPSTVAIAASFPVLLSTSNLSGRLLWGALSDRIGVASTLAMFGLSVPALLCAPFATTMVSEDPQSAVNLFRGGIMLSSLCYGGAPVMLAALPAVAALPALGPTALGPNSPGPSLTTTPPRVPLLQVMLAPAVGQIFGSAYTAQIYSRLWIAVPLANMLGTTTLSKARDFSYQRHATSLVEVCDEQAFVELFGAPTAAAAPLIEKKVCTIPLLLKCAPPGTTDPTPFLYNEVFFAIGGASTLAFVCNVAAFRIPRPTPWKAIP